MTCEQRLFISSFTIINLKLSKFYKYITNMIRKYIKMSQNKREQVISHLRYLRQELREMHLGIQDDGLFPEPGEVRGIMAQTEALLELIDGNTKIQSQTDFI